MTASVPHRVRPATLGGALLLSLAACSDNNSSPGTGNPPPSSPFLQSQTRVSFGPDTVGNTGEPELCASGSRVYAVWDEDRNGTGTTRIYVNASADGGRTWRTTDVVVPGSDRGGLDNDDSPVCCEGERVYVVWQAPPSGTTDDDVFISYSTDGGATFLPSPIRLDSPGSGDSDDPQVACSGQTVIVVWKDSRNGTDDIWFNRSTDGGATWQGETYLESTSPGATDSREHRLLVDGSNVWVVWADDRNGGYDIYLTRSTDGGATWLAQEVRVDADLPGDWNSFDPEICVLGNEVIVAWLDERPPAVPVTTGGAPEGLSGSGPFGVYCNRSTDGGLTFGATDVRLDSGVNDNITNLRLVREGNRVYTAWEDGPLNAADEIRMNRSADGGATWLSQDFRVDDTVPAGDTDAPTICADGDRVFVAWEDDRDGQDDIRLSWSNDGGVTWVPSVRVDTDPAGQSDSGSAVMLCIEGGDLLIAWRDNRDGTYDAHVNGGTPPAP